MSENPKETALLTTTQAARLLSVSPDTVLKWAKAGKIRSVRTYGGHYRIPQAALGEKSGSRSVELPAASADARPTAFQYCWEYLSGGGEIKQECRECITYRSRSRRCYELRDLPNGMGCLGVFCNTTCDQCDYFQLVQQQDITVILVSENRRLLRDRDESDNLSGFQILFAAGEYECSRLIESNRPDFVVVDCSIGKKRTSTVCHNLFNDPRIPVARIILASGRRNLEDYCDQGTFGWITRPFSRAQLRECIRGVSARVPRPDPTKAH
ncbi:MAG: excisionase family DNA-binding protein [bacterium]